MLYPVIGEVATEVHKVGAKETPKAPGMKYKHYAPNAQVVIVRTEADFDAAIAWAEQQDDVFGVLATDHVLATLPATMPQFSLGQDVTSAAHNLFAGLRYFDNHPDVKMVLAEGFETTGLGSAYMNRINNQQVANILQPPNKTTPDIIFRIISGFVSNGGIFDEKVRQLGVV